jgi:hypothetical protein
MVSPQCQGAKSTEGTSKPLEATSVQTRILCSLAFRQEIIGGAPKQSLSIACSIAKLLQ